jgi:hypothetical protein
MRYMKIESQDVWDRIKRGGPETLLTRGEAAAIVADRLKEPAEELRTVRNRVAMRIVRCLAVGTQVYSGGLQASADGRFTADQIAHWASANFPGRFDDWEKSTVCILAHLQDGISFKSSTSAQLFPATVEECHEMIRHLLREHFAMEQRYELAERERKRAVFARLQHSIEHP